MSHYSDAYPYHLDVGELDTPVPPNFKDEGYGFYYSTNKTQVHVSATGFDGTESVIRTGPFDYKLLGNTFHAHFKLSQDHYPL